MREPTDDASGSDEPAVAGGTGGNVVAESVHGRRTGSAQRERIVLAVILIVIGLAGLATQFLEPTADLGGWIVAFIGVGLLAAFFYSREYGFLVPGCIMTGLGVGIVASEVVALPNDEATGGVIVLGLGLGFLAIYGMGVLVRLSGNHWWPVIPGAILSVVGVALLIGGDAIGLLDYWGVGVVVLGILVLLRALMGRPTTE